LIDLTDDKIKVGIADMKVAKMEGVLITYALGSCVGVCLYDRQVKVGALLHIMLPQNMEANGTHPLKYADTGLRDTIRAMELRGAKRFRLTAKIAGGAKMFETGNNIGQRNVESVKSALRRSGIHLLQEDTGGSVARTMLFDVATGTAYVRCFGRPELTL
jgi:chemotaxis protein CheD